MTYPPKIWMGENHGWVNFITEGTWTPTLTFGGGSTGITYTIRTGHWYRIGDMIYVKCDISLSSKGSSTGDAIITGLPVAPYTGMSAGAPCLYYYNLTRAGTYPMMHRIDAGETQIRLAFQYNDTGSNPVTNADFVNDTRLILWSVYRAAS